MQVPSGYVLCASAHFEQSDHQGTVDAQVPPVAIAHAHAGLHCAGAALFMPACAFTRELGTGAAHGGAFASSPS
jgi:hypothetical protein